MAIADNITSRSGPARNAVEYAFDLKSFGLLHSAPLYEYSNIARVTRVFRKNAIILVDCVRPFWRYHVQSGPVGRAARQTSAHAGGDSHSDQRAF